MRRRDRRAIRSATHKRLTAVSLERRRILSWIAVPAAQFLVADARAAMTMGRIASARLWPAQEYTRLILESAVPIEHQLVVLREPNRVVLDLARIDSTPELRDLAAHVQANDPYIAGIRIGTQSAGFLRLVLDLKQDVNPQVFALRPVAEFGHRLVLDLYPLTPIDPLMALLESERKKETARQPQPAQSPWAQPPAAA